MDINPFLRPNIEEEAKEQLREIDDEEDDALLPQSAEESVAQASEQRKRHRKRAFNRIARRVYLTFDSYWDSFTKWVYEEIYEWVPIVEKAPQNIRLFLGIFYLAVATLVFIILFVYGYRQAVNTQYLSPITSFTSADTNCELIPVVNTGSYLATMSGEWEGSTNFLYSKAAYSLTVTSFTASLREYDIMMKSIYESLVVIGQQASQSDLAGNLLIWMSLAFTSASIDTVTPSSSTPITSDTTVSPTLSPTSLQSMTNSVISNANNKRLYLVGNPSSTFDREFLDASLGSVYHYCNVTPTTSFDTATAMVKISFPIAAFSQESGTSSSTEIGTDMCGALMTPKYFGYNYITKPPQFDIRLDMRTVITAVAVTTGVSSLSSLVHIPSLDRSTTTTSSTGTVSVMTVSSYYDPKYPGMSPISCLHIGGTSASDPVCVIMVGTVPVLPIFYHVGSSLNYPVKCNCTTLLEILDTNLQQPAILLDNKHPCHAFRFLTGFVYWNRADALPLFEIKQRISLISGGIAKNYHSFAYEASFLTSSLAQVSKYYNTTFTNIAYREKVFSFCKTTSGGYCSFLSLAIYDLNFKGHTISSNYYQLDYGACRNSMTPNESAWQQLIDEPFAPLSQSYQQCHDDTFTILINQTGITIGNMDLVLPICVLLLLVIIYVSHSLRERQRERARIAREKKIQEREAKKKERERKEQERRERRGSIVLLGNNPTGVVEEEEEEDGLIEEDDDDTREYYDNIVLNHYSNLEKQQAIEAFATLLLIERDRLFERETRQEIEVKTAEIVRRRSTVMQQRLSLLQQGVGVGGEGRKSVPIGLDMNRVRERREERDKEESSDDEDDEVQDIIHERDEGDKDIGKEREVEMTTEAIPSAQSVSVSHTHNTVSVVQANLPVVHHRLSSSGVPQTHMPPPPPASSSALLTNLAQELVLRLNSIEEQKKNVEFLQKNTTSQSSGSVGKLTAIVPVTNISSSDPVIDGDKRDMLDDIKV